MRAASLTLWVVLAMGTALTAQACADNESSLFIATVLAPPQRTGGASCVYSNDPTQAQLGSGVLDIAFRKTYSPSLLVGNQLVRRGSTDQLRTETSRAQLTGTKAVVYNGENIKIGEVESTTSLSVAPANGSDPSYATVPAVLINEAVVNALGPIGVGETRQVSSAVKILARTLGGKNLESNEITFSVTVCNGCLVSFPPDSRDLVREAQENKPNCSAGTSSSGAGTLSEPCEYGQDQLIDCRLCVGRPETAPVCDPGQRL